jgi:hypothetical protein
MIDGTWQTQTYNRLLAGRRATMATEDEIIELSRTKWQWMSERETDALSRLFHDRAMFVHMGATMTKDQEVEVIRTGTIQYRDIDIHESAVSFLNDTTAILLNKIRLVAIVQGSEVSNPFVVTEVYVSGGASWSLVSMSFTRLLSP